MSDTELRKDIIDLFMRMGDVAGIPDIIMKIYAIIWMTEEPISQADIQNILKDLQVSLGKTVISVSLKELTQLGVIDKIKKENERTNLYQTKSSLIEIYKLSILKILGPAEYRTRNFEKKHGKAELGMKFITEVTALHSFLRHLVNKDINIFL